MSLIDKPFTFSPNTLAKAAEVNADFDAIVNVVNGQLDDANIAGPVAEGKVTFDPVGGHLHPENKVTFDEVDGHDHSGGALGRPVSTLLAQCQLVRVNTATIRLDPCNGNRVYIPGTGKTHEIPSVGVALAVGVLGSATLYRVYLYDNAGTLTLEAVTAARGADFTTGLQIKSGDPTRLLVGMVYLINSGGGPEFRDSATPGQRFVRSWYNRGPTNMSDAVSGAMGSTTFTEIQAGHRLEFLAWADEALEVHVTGFSSNNTAGHSSTSSVGVDIVTGSSAQAPSTHDQPPASSGQRGGAAVSTFVAPTEGYHYAAAVGAVSAGTGTWSLGLVAILR